MIQAKRIPLWPPLMRGLSAKLTGGENTPSDEENHQSMRSNLSLRPFGPPPSSEGGIVNGGSFAGLPAAGHRVQVKIPSVHLKMPPVIGP